MNPLSSDCAVCGKIIGHMEECIKLDSGPYEGWCHLKCTLPFPADAYEKTKHKPVQRDGGAMKKQHFDEKSLRELAQKIKEEHLHNNYSPAKIGDRVRVAIDREANRIILAALGLQLDHWGKLERVQIGSPISKELAKSLEDKACEIARKALKNLKIPAKLLKDIQKITGEAPHLIAIKEDVYAVTQEGDVWWIDQQVGTAQRVLAGTRLLTLPGSSQSIVMPDGTLIFDARGGWLIALDPRAGIIPEVADDQPFR